MMTKTHFDMFAGLLILVIAGCENRTQPTKSSSSEINNPPPQSTSALSAAVNVTDRWLGKWIGPEGTYLVLSKNGDKYIVEIHSLDGSATYKGTSASDHIEFQRNGKSESIHAGNGEETGLKWLLDKTNCLIVRTGEGFCRD